MINDTCHSSICYRIFRASQKLCQASRNHQLLAQHGKSSEREGERERENLSNLLGLFGQFNIILIFPIEISIEIHMVLLISSETLGHILRLKSSFFFS